MEERIFFPFTKKASSLFCLAYTSYLVKRLAGNRPSFLEKLGLLFAWEKVGGLGGLTDCIKPV